MLATGVVEAEEEDVLLEAELMPEVPGMTGRLTPRTVGNGTVSRCLWPASSVGGASGME